LLKFDLSFLGGVFRFLNVGEIEKDVPTGGVMPECLENTSEVGLIELKDVRNREEGRGCGRGGRGRRESGLISLKKLTDCHDRMRQRDEQIDLTRGRKI
jgi:hypothetical protein